MDPAIDLTASVVGSPDGPRSLSRLQDLHVDGAGVPRLPARKWVDRFEELEFAFLVELPRDCVVGQRARVQSLDLQQTGSAQSRASRQLRAESGCAEKQVLGLGKRRFGAE